MAQSELKKIFDIKDYTRTNVHNTWYVSDTEVSYFEEQYILGALKDLKLNKHIDAVSVTYFPYIVPNFYRFKVEITPNNSKNLKNICERAMSIYSTTGPEDQKHIIDISYTYNLLWCFITVLFEIPISTLRTEHANRYDSIVSSQ